MQETDRNFEKRKKVIYQFMQDELYVPMKLKEIAAVLRISREEKEELRAVQSCVVFLIRLSVGMIFCVFWTK